ncbi:MAG: antitoxin [Micrococcales bacterium]|nr:antitoxin [Micrococcales bacterium]
MRTTVTLDPDAEQVIRQRMAAKGISFKQALNQVIRDGAPSRADYVFRTPTVDAHLLVDITKANALLGELEDDAIIEKMRAGK